MNTRKKQLSLALFLIILVSISGCVLPGGEKKSGYGVVIESFEADFSQVYAGEPFKLQLKIKNVGSVDAEAVYPRLYNIGKTTTLDNKEITCEEACEAVRLLAPDPESGTMGESKTCIYDCRAPLGIDRGVSVNYNPSVRVYYVYKTDTIKSITIVPQSELRSIQAQNKPLPSETVSTTTGPVSVNVKVQRPIRYWEDMNSVTFPIEIEIQNIGDGVACLPEIGAGGHAGFWGYMYDYMQSATPIMTSCKRSENWNKVYLESRSTDVTLTDCDLKIGGSPIKLWKSQTASVVCEATVPVTPGQRGYVQKSIEMMASYGYFVDTSTTVTVIGSSTRPRV